MVIRQEQTIHDPCDPAHHRWAVILAGGDGKRLLPLTRLLAGDDRPKQYCRVLGAETLLDQTLGRVAQVVNPDRTFAVVSKEHESFYREGMSGATGKGLLVQPRNRGTAPAIAYSMVRLHELDRDAVVGIFPSDHYFADDIAFSDCVREAFESAELNSGAVVLLGMRPNQPETAYGWIEPGDPLENVFGPVFRVRRFWEKPSPEVALELMDRGCFWNSFIMIGHVRAFLDLMGQAVPTLLRSFQSVVQALFTRIEEATILDVYMAIPSSSFSKDVLSACPDSLAVLCNSMLEWADVGDVDRALSVGRCADTTEDLRRLKGRLGMREKAYPAAATA